jgi:hypothetical protein
MLSLLTPHFQLFAVKLNFVHVALQHSTEIYEKSHALDDALVWPKHVNLLGKKNSTV